MASAAARMGCAGSCKNAAQVRSLSCKTLPSFTASSGNGRASQIQPMRAVLDPPLREASGSGGTGLLEKPGFDRSQPADTEHVESGLGSAGLDRGKKLGGGNFRVLLLDDPKHSEQLVVRVLTLVVPGVDELTARNLFETSKQLGQAIVTTALREHAEFYASQILRKGVRSTIEPDTTTL